ncbi:hypothetical protein L1049_013544 [Liquidambar formosana]|uniref:Disease resistance R13L4/SHOC-2-like LRR domain-containing protein n=1 Tax=Liquidambar formosana TaxID=63359 RepID=A0AAP0WUD7_LIQFO
MNNKITTLPDCVIKYSNTYTTLLLQGNQPLEKVPERFLLGFQALEVLNMSGTSIKSLPLSPTQLGELRALVLRQCSIKELTPLEGLKKLQVLNLSGTPIKELPEVMKELSNLRQLDLSFTSYLVSIPAGIVSRWSGLEVLDIRQSAFQWGVKGEVGKGRATVEELGCLKQLIAVHISLGRMPYLDIEDLIWIERLRNFKISVGQKLDSLA